MYTFARLIRALTPDKNYADRTILPEVGSIQIVWVEEKFEEEFQRAVSRHLDKLDPNFIEVGDSPDESEESPQTCWIHIHVMSEDSSSGWTNNRAFTTAEFLHHFEPIPEDTGEAEYDRCTRELAGKFKQENLRLTQKTGSGAVESLMGGTETTPARIGTEPTEEPPAAPVQGEETSLMAPETRKSAGAIRNSIHAHKRDIQKQERTIHKIKSEITARINEKMELLKEMQESAGSYLKRLENALTTVNLYLGRDEEITVIRKGSRAAADTPITIRQLVLHMDEEMALACPEGIDFQSIKTFDEWLIAEDNVNCIIPEEKGVVVLKPRRHARHYDDNPIVNALMNEHNFKSYWLLRNGENLYRIHTGLEVGQLLIPRRDATNEFFFTTNRQGERVPLRPGSAEYYKAMEKADAAGLKTMQVALMLQGILDRTLIFAPYPDQIAPNLLDPRTFGNSVRILRDWEDTISEGRPTYTEWLKEKNHQLGDGDRIVGSFNSHPTIHGHRDENRVSPKGASGYDEEFIRTITKDKHGLKFLFERTDAVYRRNAWGSLRSADPQKRGSYRIYPNDPFILNIDRVTAEEIHYYLHDRRSRDEYANMIPTLQRALALKRSEEAKERPFVELLERELKKVEKPSLPITPELLSELILDWKTRNKTRETLLEKESLAYTSIVSNYKKLVKTRRMASPETLEQFVAETLRQQPETLKISCSLDGVIRIVQPAREGSVFCHILETRADADGRIPPQQVVREWVTKRETHTRGKTLFESGEFHERKDNPHDCQIPGNLAIDPVDLLRADMATINERRQKHEEGPIKLVAVTRRGDIYRGFFFDTHKETRRERKTKLVARKLEKSKEGITSLGRGQEEQDLASYHHFWGDKPAQFVPEPKNDREKNAYSQLPFPLPEGANLGMGKWFWRTDFPSELLFFDQAVFLEVDKALQAEIRQRRKEERRRQAVSQAVDRIAKTATTHWKEKETRIYLDQGGDMQFWDDHCKTLVKPDPHKNRDNLYAILDAIARRDGRERLRDFSTLREILREADTLTQKNAEKDWIGRYTDFAHCCKMIRKDSELIEILDRTLVNPETPEEEEDNE